MAGKLGLIVGGGPAPGINGVISSVTIEAINHNLEVVGFRDGFKYLVQGNAENIRRLTIDQVSRLHGHGGSILGTSRTNPAKNEADMARVLETFKRLGITTLVTVDFAKWIKLAIPEDCANLRRWYATVAARPSAKA